MGTMSGLSWQGQWTLGPVGALATGDAAAEGALDAGEVCGILRAGGVSSDMWLSGAGAGWVVMGTHGREECVVRATGACQRFNRDGEEGDRMPGAVFPFSSLGRSARTGTGLCSRVPGVSSSASG